MKTEFINKLLQTAIDEGNRLDVPITISIVDSGGHLVAVLRQENCSYFALESSRKKAVTSSQLKVPSHVLGDVLIKFPELIKSLDNNKDIELLAGGFPIIINNITIGGIGIAGGNFEQDRVIGECVIKMMNDLAAVL